MPEFAKLFHSIKDRQILTLLLLGFGLVCLALAPLPASFTAPRERFFRIQANNFNYSPSLLHANPGDRVTIELASQDVVHGIYIDGYDLEVHADPGQPRQLSFVADKPGSFRLRCSVTCGALHPFMIAQLKVGVNWLFWKALGGAVLAALAGLWWMIK